MKTKLQNEKNRGRELRQKQVIQEENMKLIGESKHELRKQSMIPVNALKH